MLWLVVFEIVYGCLLFFFLGVSGGSYFQAGVFGNVWFSSEFSFFFDFLSGVFFYMLLCCGVSALLYCVHYYFGVGWKNLFCLMLVFLNVMVLLVFSGSLMTCLVFWEYLGFVSFLLILYYSNLSGLRAAVVTLVSSRFGDVGLFCLFCCSCYDCGIWGDLSSVLVFLVVSGKSASYPFISWLVEAMRAPTPVSSLVHSSTLVAAGAWFFLRYAEFFNEFSVWLVFMSVSITVVFSAVCACCVIDVKKVVAFSTCNNISWCLLYFICGDAVLSVCQLLVHGLCKSLLFMSVGDLMISSGSSQSGVNVFSSLRLSWLSCLLNIFLIWCLCGLPFLGVFAVKHVFLSNCFFEGSVFYFLFVVSGFFLSYVYSFRFAAMLFSDVGGLSVGYFPCFSAVSGFICVVYSVVLVLMGLLDDVAVSGGLWGCFLLFVQGLGCFSGVVVWICGTRNPFLVSRIFGCDVVVVWLFLLYLSFGEALRFWLFRWEVLVWDWLVRKELRSTRVYGLGLNGVLIVVGWIFVFYLQSLFF